jgi:hypothetical protein
VSHQQAPPPGSWTRLARQVNPRTVRMRVTATAGLALTAAIMLGWR